VADARRLDLNQNFALARAFQINFDDFQGFSSGKGYGGTRFHGGSPSIFGQA
jgi:hypothetical protein